MTDFNACIGSVVKAAGRDLDADELEHIFTQSTRVLRRELGRLHPTHNGLPGDVTPDVLRAAAQRVVANIIHEKTLAKRRIALAVERGAANRATIAAMHAGSYPC
jgi:hypothetical protein